MDFIQKKPCRPKMYEEYAHYCSLRNAAKSEHLVFGVNNLTPLLVFIDQQINIQTDVPIYIGKEIGKRQPGLKVLRKLEFSQLTHEEHAELKQLVRKKINANVYEKIVNMSKNRDPKDDEYIRILKNTDMKKFREHIEQKIESKLEILNAALNRPDCHKILLLHFANGKRMRAAVYRGSYCQH